MTHKLGELENSSGNGDKSLDHSKTEDRKLAIHRKLGTRGFIPR
jgi:hypothetical protein